MPAIPPLGCPRVSTKRATISASPVTAARVRPRGHGTHHYHFRLLAVSRPTLDLKAPTTGLDVVRAAEPYVIERTELVGTYHR
jgi:hypothetical protein